MFKKDVFPPLTPVIEPLRLRHAPAKDWTGINAYRPDLGKPKEK